MAFLAKCIRASAVGYAIFEFLEWLSQPPGYLRVAGRTKEFKSFLFRFSIAIFLIISLNCLSRPAKRASNLKIKMHYLFGTPIIPILHQNFWYTTERAGQCAMFGSDAQQRCSANDASGLFGSIVYTADFAVFSLIANGCLFTAATLAVCSQNTFLFVDRPG